MLTSMHVGEPVLHLLHSGLPSCLYAHFTCLTAGRRLPDLVCMSAGFWFLV